MESKKFGFIGAGNMAYAIAKGLVDSGMVKPDAIIASARTKTRLDTVWKVCPTFFCLRHRYLKEIDW